MTESTHNIKDVELGRNDRTGRSILNGLNWFSPTVPAETKLTRLDLTEFFDHNFLVDQTRGNLAESSKACQPSLNGPIPGANPSSREQEGECVPLTLFACEQQVLAA